MMLDWQADKISDKEYFEYAEQEKKRVYAKCDKIREDFKNGIGDGLYYEDESELVEQ